MEDWQSDQDLALAAASYLREELLKHLAADPEMSSRPPPLRKALGTMTKALSFPQLNSPTTSARPESDTLPMLAR